MLKHMFESSSMALEIILNVFPSAILDLFREVLMGVFSSHHNLHKYEHLFVSLLLFLALQDFLPPQYFTKILSQIILTFFWCRPIKFL